MDRFVIISGCSGGGKSTLVTELARRGQFVVEEPGRRIVREELASGGTALPWIDRAAFARRLVAMARADYEASTARDGTVFFDRGLIDAAAALQHVTGEPALAKMAGAYRFHRRVFLAPPWPEIFLTDAERRHGFDAAEAEYARLVQVYPSLGYEIALLPKLSVFERAEFVLGALDPPPPAA